MSAKQGAHHGRGGLFNRGGRGGGRGGGPGRGGSAGTGGRGSQRGRGQVYSRGRGRGRGGGITTPNNEPRMTPKTWSSINNSRMSADDRERSPLTPNILMHGLPPDPNASDSYTDKWKKLILMEFHALLSDFRRDQRQCTESFDDQAHVHVDFFPGEKPYADKEKVLISTEIKAAGGRVVWKPKDPAALTPADLDKTLLKTESGWLYITSCEHDENKPVNEFPVVCSAISYNESFTRVPMPSEPARAIVFDSFTTFIYRFKSLCAFETKTDADIKEVIENGLIHACRERKATLKPVAKGARAKSKLNDSQFDILTKIRAPVDFVQGPPGTGKSTFIVEYVKTRLPQGPGSRVLICTTTNKAIDSLTEKLAASGCGDEMLAVGNAARLGPTSAQFLVKNRVEHHAAVQAFEHEVLLTGAFRGLCTTYDTIQARHQQLTTILDSDKSTKEQVDEANDAMRDVFTTLRSSVKLVETSPKSLRQHKLIGRDTTKSIEDTRQGMRRATRLRDLMDTVDRYRASVSSAAKAVRSAVRVSVITNARYVVCTAAVAATLPDRMAREMNSATSDSSSDADSDTNVYTFEHVILDEAGAMLEPDVIGTIVHGCRSLLSVGDHKQLPPFTKWRWGSRFGYDVSLMMRLSQKAVKNHNMMTTQYRMHPHLAEIVSSQFYGNALKTAESTSRERIRRQPVVLAEVKGDEETRGTSFLNREEIAAVVALVQRERQTNATQTINVICFHKPQFKEIWRELVKLGLLKEDATGESLAQLPTLDVCTVDSMQGREADVVILSCVRTNQHGIGFLANVNRVNVALSRAKQVVYIVGSRAALSTDTTWRKVLNHQHVKR